MNNKELIRCALMGDKQAQEECTAKGIVLPCPFCGGKATMQQDITGRESYHVACSNVKDMCNLIAGLPMWSESEEDALKSWNARPAPPIGRCKDCINATNPGSNIVFCDYFEPDMMPDDFVVVLSQGKNSSEWW